jgi:hypothetical protein
MKVSPFLRQETAKLSLLPKPVFVSGQAAKVWQAVWDVEDSFTRAVNNRVEARSARAGQSSRDIPRGDTAFHTLPPEP